MSDIYSHHTIVICVPVYNESTLIIDTLESIQNQSYNDFLCVIRDNCSTDGTNLICSKFCENDSRFVFLQSEENEGAAKNFLKLKNVTDSPFIMWLGAHDKISSSFLSEAIDILSANDGVSLSYSRVKWISESDEVLKETNGGNFLISDTSPLKRYIKIATKITGECTAINGLIRRSSLKRYNYPHVFDGPDHLILAQLQFEGKFYRIDRALYQRRLFNKRLQNYSERITGIGVDSHGDDSLYKKNMWPLIFYQTIDYLTLPVFWIDKLKNFPRFFIGMLWLYKNKLMGFRKIFNFLLKIKIRIIQLKKNLG